MAVKNKKLTPVKKGLVKAADARMGKNKANAKLAPVKKGLPKAKAAARAGKLRPVKRGLKKATFE